MAAMTKVVSFKVSNEAANLQALLTAAAKKAGIPVWELLSRMLEQWEQAAGSGQPAGDEWKATVEGRLRALEAELEAIKVQRSNSLLVNQTMQRMQRMQSDINHSAVNVQEEEPKSGLLVNQVNEVIENIVIEPEVNQDDAALSPDQVLAEEEAEESRESEELLVNQDENEKAAQVVSLQVNYFEQFEAAFDALMKDRHAVIADLRRALDWPSEQFESVLRQLRDEGKYQLQAGDTAHLTKKQVAGGFTDENGFKFLTIMRRPAELTEAEPEKTKKRQRRPRKPKSSTSEAETPRVDGREDGDGHEDGEAAAQEPEKPKRGRGRPRKDKNAVK
jgi:hypothetical protein